MGELSTSRRYFEQVLSASRDAESCVRQLARLEGRAASLSGGSFEPRTRSTPDPRRMEGRIATYVDMESKFESRMAEDYATIDRACAVLYGDDAHAGLYERSAVWADVLWWRYLDGATWDRVGSAVGYSARPCQQFRDQAFAWMDENEFRFDIMDAS